MPPLDGSGRPRGHRTASRRFQAVLGGSEQLAFRHLRAVLSDAEWPLVFGWLWVATYALGDSGWR